jgi:hypothetical protein
LGSYTIIVVVDGIESNLSNDILVERDENLADYGLIDAIIGLFIGLISYMIFRINRIERSDSRFAM